MEKKTFTIANISCGHCVMTITVEWEAPASMDTIKAKLKEINYPVE